MLKDDDQYIEVLIIDQLRGQIYLSMNSKGQHCMNCCIVCVCILARYSSLLQTTENQFGFKSNSSTDLCFSLKQVIDYYRYNGSPVYLCFLDASKAFDRVPHNILFSKLFE